MTLPITWFMSSAERLNLINASLILDIMSLTIGSLAKEFNKLFTILIPSFALLTIFSNILAIISFSLSQSLKATMTLPIFLVIFRASKLNAPNTSLTISNAAFKAPPTILVRISNTAITPLNVLFNLLAVFFDMIKLSENLYNADKMLYRPFTCRSTENVSSQASLNTPRKSTIDCSILLIAPNTNSLPLIFPIPSIKPSISSLASADNSIASPVAELTSLVVVATLSSSFPAFIRASIVFWSTTPVAASPTDF